MAAADGHVAGEFGYCELCKISLNGPVVAENHYNGKRHKDKVAGRGRGSGAGAPRGRPWRGRAAGRLTRVGLRPGLQGAERAFIVVIDWSHVTPLPLHL